MARCRTRQLPRKDDASWQARRQRRIRPSTEKAKSTEAEKATGTSRKITDLSLGDIVLIPGFDGPRTICDATKVGDGADAGKFELALRDEAGEVEHARFGPDEEVQVVGKAAKGGKASPVPAESAARKTSSKGKGTKNKAPKPEGAKKAKKEPKPPKEKKTSALDAAAKVLGENGEPMNCQEMIKAMSDKGYWKSPGGLTPHATLVLRDAQRDQGEGEGGPVQEGRSGEV